MTDVRALVDRFNAAWNEHDLDAALALCTDDMVFESTNPAPDGARCSGRQEVRTAWEPIFADHRTRFGFEETWVVDKTLVQLWRFSWGDGHVRGVDVIEVRGDLVARKLSYVKG